jgi:DNA-binding IclR family transcriptional regulator
VTASTTPAGSAERGSGNVRTAVRVVAVIDLLAQQGPLKLGQIAEQLELPKSSAHGLVQTLARAGYLEHRNDRSYGLGLRLWQVAQSYDGIERVRRLVKPVMDDLVDATRETVQLAQLDGADALYLEISLSPEPVRLASAIGERLPAHATGIGKALLASLDPEDARARLERAELAPMTPSTITDVDELMQELARIRQRGYGLDNEEALPGLRCIAMPVQDGSGATIALSVSIPSPRHSREVAASVRRNLAEAVAEASRRLGESSEP